MKIFISNHDKLSSAFNFTVINQNKIKVNFLKNFNQFDLTDKLKVTYNRVSTSYHVK